MLLFKVIKREGRARRGEFTCPHGTVQTPVFMNVGTQGAIKGALSARDLKEIGCQIELSNTYHLHVRPGDELIKSLGGLHKFMTWDGPILTDSGGFQIFSLAELRKIGEDGVRFNSHVDGRHIFMGPEESMRIQSNLGSDIAMAFDECIKIPSPYDYVKASIERTARWLVRCKTALEQYNSEPDAVNPGQVLFGINQGAVFHDLRIEHMKRIAELDLAGYAIGGGHVLHVVCDLTIAADNAKFGQTGPKVGSFDGGLGSSYLARIVGQKKAREIWYLCRQYDARQALDMGLVNTVVPLEDLEEETLSWCRQMLRHSPLALRCLKASLNADCDGQMGLLDLAGNATLLYYMSEEAKEGKNAFVEKRAPDFSKFPRLP